MRRGLFYTLLTQAPTLLLYFVASTLMTRMLGEVGRGEYALITNFGALLAMVMGLNIGGGITYFVARAADNVRETISAALAVLLINIVLAPLILGVVSLNGTLTELFMPDTRQHWTYWAFVCLFVIQSLVNNTVSGVLLGLKKFAALNTMSVLNAGLSALGMLVLFMIPQVKEDAFLWILVATTVTSTVVTLTWCAMYLFHVRMLPGPNWSWAVLKPILAFSMLGHLSNLINLVNYRFDVWVVDQHHGVAQLGLYAVAVGLGQLLFNVPDPFSRVVQPFLFGQRTDAMLARFKAVARLNFTVLVLLALGMAATAPWIVPLLFGAEFAPSVAPLRLLLPGIVLSGAAKLLAQLVIQGGLQHFNLMATAIAAVVTMVLDLVLIPTWGIHGAAVASTVAYCVVLLVILGTIRSRMGIAIHDMFILHRADITLLRQRPPGDGQK